MFPYSDKTAIVKKDDDYTIILDFNTSVDTEYNGHKFAIAEIERLFEHAKFSNRQILVYYSEDFLQTDFTLNEVYGYIDGIYFHKDVIKVEIKLSSTRIGELLKALIDARVFGKDTKFFTSVTHVEGKELALQNLYPSLKKYSHDKRSDMGHFEGEIS